ncbi:hypothetical protein D3C76_230650 [compost metagenome]
MFGNFLGGEGWRDYLVMAFIIMLLIIGTIPCVVLAIIKCIKTKEKFTICWQQYMEKIFSKVGS